MPPRSDRSWPSTKPVAAGGQPRVRRPVGAGLVVGGDGERGGGDAERAGGVADRVVAAGEARGGDGVGPDVAGAGRWGGEGERAVEVRGVLAEHEAGDAGVERGVGAAVGAGLPVGVTVSRAGSTLSVPGA